MAAAEADRRLAMLGEVGTVTAVEGARVRVRVAGLDTQPIPVAQQRMGAVKISAMPSEGEQVVLLMPGGDIARALVLCSLPRDGDLVAAGGLSMDLGGGTLTIVNGRIVIDGDVVSGGISLQEHVHGGVAVGGAQTAVPS
ncbi:MAG: phage baseplate assembly protein V [Paracoccaceae bacterium]